MARVADVRRLGSDGAGGPAPTSSAGAARPKARAPLSKTGCGDGARPARAPEARAPRRRAAAPPRRLRATLTALRGRCTLCCDSRSFSSALPPAARERPVLAGSGVTRESLLASAAQREVGAVARAAACLVRAGSWHRACTHGPACVALPFACGALPRTDFTASRALPPARRRVLTARRPRPAWAAGRAASMGSKPRPPSSSCARVTIRTTRVRCTRGRPRRSPARPRAAAWRRRCSAKGIGARL